MSVLESLSFKPPENFRPENSTRTIFVTALTALICQVTVRQLVLSVLGRDHPKRGVAPRLATKLVSILFNFLMVDVGATILLFPDATLVANPIDGYSSALQFWLSIAAGYFLWATTISVFYQGSTVAIVTVATFGLLCFIGLTPFMQGYVPVFLLMQGSTLILDLYSCGRLLVRRESKNLFLSIIHPLTFFLVRIVFAVPTSFLQLQFLAENFPTENVSTAVVFLIAAVLVNIFNVYWFFAMLSHRSVGSVVSVGRGGQTMNVKWFAFNLNWFDIGITLTFGNIQTTKLKITNSSYRYARPGLTLPLALVLAALILVHVAEPTGDYSHDDLLADVIRAVAVVFATGALEHG
eukprot:gene748-493_t